MTDEADLLRAVCEHPAEDTPRLMYADWLDENHRGRHAAFIRKWVAVGPWRELKSTSTRPQVTLWAGDGCSVYWGPSGKTRLWVKGEMRQVCDRIPIEFDWASGPQLLFDRGFLSHVTCTGDDWIAYADTITAGHPVERVTLTRLPHYMKFPPGSRFEATWLDLAGSTPSGRTVDALPVALAHWFPGITFDLSAILA